MRLPYDFGNDEASSNENSKFKCQISDVRRVVGSIQDYGGFVILHSNSIIIELNNKSTTYQRQTDIPECNSIVFYFILIMTTLKLEDLTLIKNIKSTPTKTTSEYKIANTSGVKSKFIVKTFTLPHKSFKEGLLSRELRQLNKVKEISPIREVEFKKNEAAQTLIVIEEYQTSSNLTELIDQKWEIDFQVLRNLTLAVRQLHSQGIYHMNLKCENILLDNKSFKLSDAWTSFLRILRHQKSMETYPTIPPEAKAVPIGSDQWDVWSLGIIFLELMLHRRILPQEASLPSLHMLIDNFNDSYITVLLKAMICEKNERFTINEVFEYLKEKKEILKSTEKFINVRLQLFASLPLKLPSIPSKIESTFKKVETWVVQIILFHTQAGNQFLLLSTRSTLQTVKTSLNFIINNSPNNLHHFKNVRQLYEQLKKIKEQNYRFQNDGNLVVKIKIATPIKESPQKQKLPQKKQVKKSEVKKVDPKIEDSPKKQKSQVTPQQTPKSSKEFISPKQKAIKKIQTHQNIVAEDEDLGFDSDLQTDILTAFKSYKKSDKNKETFQLLELITKIQNPQIEIISMHYEQMGNNYDDDGDYEEAKDAYKAARQGYIAKFNRNSEKQMNLLINLGSAYAKLKKYERAVKCFKKCAFIAQQRKQFETQCMAFRNWGNVALHAKDLQTAERCYQKQLEISQHSEGDPTQDRCTAYANLSNIYLHKQEFAKSNDCIREYMGLNRKKEGERVAVLNFNWGYGLLYLHQFQDSFSKFEESLRHKFKENMKTRMEMILLDGLRKKKDLINSQFATHKQSIVSIRLLLQAQSQKKLEAIFEGLKA